MSIYMKLNKGIRNNIVTITSLLYTFISFVALMHSTTLFFMIIEATFIVGIISLIIKHFVRNHDKNDYRTYASLVMAKHFKVNPSNISFQNGSNMATINHNNGIVTYVPTDYITDNLMIKDIKASK